MKILITGAAGFIGFHLAGKLLKEGHNITGLDSINDYYDTGIKYSRLEVHGIDAKKIFYNKIVKSNNCDNYQFIQLQAEDRENLGKIFSDENFDVVVNLAAQAGVRYSLINPHAYIDSNIVGFMNVLECCRNNNIKHLVYASSSSVYGMNESSLFSASENTDHPLSIYAATKKSNELMAHVYSHLFQVPTTGIRFFSVYGPWGRPDMALFLFTKAILENKPIQIFNNGDMVRNFTYIDDAIEGLYKAICHPPKADPSWEAKHPDPSTSSAPFKVYNIASDHPVKLMDLVALIEDSLGKKAEKKFLPLQSGDVPISSADISRITLELGYHPVTSIQIGVKRFIEWYKEYYKK